MKRIILLSIVCLFIIGCTPDTNYDEFTKCLSENDIVMYGSFLCTHCNDFKKQLGDSVDYLGYVECHPSGKNAQPELCQAAGITAYPTFIIGGDTDKMNWLIGPTVYELSQKTGCVLPSIN